MSNEPDPLPIVFIWWGENATEQDKETWRHFKAGFPKIFPNAFSSKHRPAKNINNMLTA